MIAHHQAELLPNSTDQGAELLKQVTHVGPAILGQLGSALKHSGDLVSTHVSTSPERDRSAHCGSCLPSADFLGNLLSASLLPRISHRGLEFGARLEDHSELEAPASRTKKDACRATATSGQARSLDGFADSVP